MHKWMMHKPLQHSLWLLLAAAILLSGCGRKEVPQVASVNGEKPQIVNLKYEAMGNVLRLDFNLSGDTQGVGYQIDRTRIDPYCQCPGFWRRYLEQAAIKGQEGSRMNRMIHLNSTSIEYLFRIRAIDSYGQLGPWSKMIRARGVDLFNK